jgi:hypothetical protein
VVAAAVAAVVLPFEEPELPALPEDPLEEPEPLPLDDGVLEAACTTTVPFMNGWIVQM